MTKICLLSHTHLCRNPRVVKEAHVLKNAGFEVHIVNSIYSKALLEEDLLLLGDSDFKLYHAFDPTHKNITSTYARLIKKIGNALIYYFHLENIYGLGYAPNAYLRICKKIDASLYICHQELPAVIGTKLIRSGYRTGFDFEDLYSENYLDEVKKHNPVGLIKKAEQFALKHGAFVFTPTTALANYYHESYGGKPAVVLRNVFNFDAYPATELKVNTIKRLYWFSQMIGEGRGLELLFDALNLVNTKVELHLRGDSTPSFLEKLKQRLPSRHALFIHPMIANEFILEDMRNYDIGLALEPNHPINKMLTASNKIYHYLSGGLAVIASNTTGQLEVANQQTVPAIFTFKNNSAHELADQINALLQDDLQLLQAKKNALNLAENQFNWLNEQKILLKTVADALEN